jgi:hypothetical protein
MDERGSDWQFLSHDVWGFSSAWKQVCLQFICNERISQYGCLFTRKSNRSI